MPSEADFDVLIDKFNAATDKVAAKLEALKAELLALGLTAAQEAVVAEKLGAAIATLEALGADPADPVPSE